MKTLAISFWMLLMAVWLAFVESFAFKTTKMTCCPPLMMVAGIGKKYTPKWKKKETLASQIGQLDDKDKGLIGSIPVKFVQGNQTKITMALPGQPLKQVAIQAGQFINYKCGKGECGTCESMCNGKWIRPCIAKVPAGLDIGQEYYTLQVKEVKSKTKSSGKFYSVKSFVMGFYNNLLGMVGFVRTRREARRNWMERQEYERQIRELTLVKRRQRLQQEAAQWEANRRPPPNPLEPWIKKTPESILLEQQQEQIMKRPNNNKERHVNANSKSTTSNEKNNNEKTV
mmetsp:Transcript_2498/g.5731  ORF Transcript_2498/g.5731 Transcript_2498/m.5731 type:complete len:285 (+) Transcript_2498:182-1036(+)